jgi:TP901 family phage tail tape measure protein
VSKRDVVIHNQVVIEGKSEIESLKNQLKSERETVEELRYSLIEARGEVENLEEELGRIKSGSGFAALEEELERFKRTASGAAQEFKAFLRSVNLDDGAFGSTAQFEDLFKKIRDGSLTSSQAIFKVKTELAHLMEENYKSTGGAFDTTVIQNFSAALEKLSSTVDTVLDKVNSIQTNGVSVAGASAGGGGNVVEMFKQIEESAKSMSDQSKASIESVTQLVGALGEYANIDANKLTAVAHAFRGLGDVATGSIGKASVENIINLVKKLKEIGADGRFNFGIDLSGFRDLKVSKASLSNLAEFLPRISGPDVDTSKLQDLAKVDLKNFNDLHISKASMESLSKFADTEQIGQILSRLEQLSQGMSAATQTVSQETGATGKAMNTEGSQVNALSDAYGKHAAAVEDAADAERKKKAASDEVSSGLQEEAYSTDQATESARQHDRALKTVVDTLSNVKTKMHALASIDGGTETAEYASLQGLEASLEELRDKSDQYSAKHISDEMAKLQLAFSEAKLGVNVFTMETKDSANEIKATFDQLMSIQKDIGGKQIDFLKLDPTKNAEEMDLLLHEIDSLSSEYDRLFGTINKDDLSTEQWDRLTAAMEKTASKADLLSAKKADIVNAFSANLQFGNAHVEFDNITKKFEALTNATQPLKDAMSKLQDAQIILTSDDASMEQKLQAYRDYISLIGQVRAEVNNQYSAEERLNNLDKQRTDALSKAATIEQKHALLSKSAKNALKQSYDEVAAAAEKLSDEEWKATASEEAKKAAVDKLTDAMKKYNAALGEANSGKVDKADSLTSRVVHIFSLANVLMKATQEIKKMISTSIELDTAMTQLRVVAQASQSEFDAYGRTVTQTAKDIGASVTDLIDSTTTFARLGYSLDESSELARVSSMIANVGAIDVSETQNALTAITKAYDVSASEIESVMDKLVIVGNNFPISVSELAVGLNNAGSALAAAGNSFEQSVALLTAANTTVQNISKSSTGLRTITARIRSTKTELDELGEAIETSKYEKVIETLTSHNVLLTTANGEYRTTYDILQDIASVWKSLTSMEKAAIAEQLAGNRQQNVFYSIIEQFQEAQNAMRTMDDSEGALQNAYSTFLDSVQAKINRFKATFQDLSQSLFDSNMLSGFVSVGTFIFNGLSNILGTLDEIHVLLPSIASLAGGVVFGAFKKIADTWKGLSVNPWVFGVTAVIGLIASIVTQINRAKEESVQAAKEAAESISQIRADRDSTVNSSIERIEELKNKISEGALSSSELYAAQQELLGIRGGLVDALGDEAAAIDIIGLSAEDAAARIRELNDELNVSDAKGFIADANNRKQYENARDILSRRVRSISAEGDQAYIFADGKTGEYALQGLYDELDEIIAKYDSVNLKHTGHSIQNHSILNYTIEVDADAEKAKDDIQSIFYDLDALRKKHSSDTGYVNRIKAIQDNLGVELSAINKDISEYNSIYVEWQKSTILANDDYRSVYGELIAAQRDYSDALSNTNLSEDERAKTLESAIKRAEAARDTITSVFAADPEAGKYLDALFEKFSSEAEKEKYRIKLRADLEIDKDSANNLQKSIVSSLAVFANDDGEFKLSELLLANQDFENQTDEVRFALSLLNAVADSYGTTLEGLIPILADFGIINSDQIDSLNTLSDSLSGATTRLAEYKKAMEDGEKGDTAAQYVSAYKKFKEDVEAGRTDSNAVNAAVHLFLSDETLSELGYDLESAIKELSGPMYDAIFSGEGEAGANFANYLKDIYSEGMDGVYSVIENGDGTFDIAIDSFDKLAESLNVDKDMFFALIDAMDLYGTQVALSAEGTKALAEEIGIVGASAPVDNYDKVAAAIAGISKEFKTTDPVKIRAFLNSFNDAGLIDLDSIEDLGTLISETIEKVKETEDDEPTFTLDADISSVESAVKSVKDLIGSLPDTVQINFVARLGEGPGVTTGAISGFTAALGGGAYRNGQTGQTVHSKASGTKNARGGETLVNELGPELISENGEAYIAGGGKPAIVDLSPGAIVLDAEDTKKALSGGGLPLSRLRFHAAASGMKVCPVCGTRNPISNVFCINCGAKLRKGASTSTYDRTSRTDGTFPNGAGGGSGGGGSGGGGGGGSGGSNGDNWFERQYAEHKHLVEMDKESQKDFLDWLNDAYKKAYDEGIIDLKEYRQHEEEVYKGRQNDFKDHLSDTEHLISLEENGNNDPTVIYNYYVQMMADIEKELEKAYANGLDSTNEYVQYLQNAWYKYQNEIEKRQEEANDTAKKQVKDLVDYRIKMLKQYLKNEIQTLKDRLSYLKEFYSKQKEMLQDERDNENYLDSQAEKRKAISDIQAELTQLEYDNSAWAQKRKKKLAEELANAQKELNDFEKDHALKVAQDQLDAVYEAQEKSINSEVDALQEKLDNPQYLYEQALNDVQNNSIALYEEMIEFNNKYGSGIKQDIVDKWEEAYISLRRYFDLYGEYYKDINLVNATGYVPDGNYENIVVARGRGYSSGTTHATRGLHRVDELGAEYVFTSKDGNRYRLLNDGDKMLNAESTDFLYRLATNGKSIISRLLNGNGFNRLALNAAGSGATEIRMGDIIIQGNADERTVSEIRRAQRDGINTILKEFIRLKK